MSSSLQTMLSKVTFAIMHNSLNVWESMNIPVISTTRPLCFYRKVLFNNVSAPTLAEELRYKTIIDVGCGLTPFIEDSMYQWSRRHDINFYGIDPKVKDGFKFGTFDRIKSFATGAKTAPNPKIKGLEKTIATYSTNLPFENESVDIALSCWLVFSWLRSDDILTETFIELDRVIKPGGTIRMFPTQHIDQIQRKYPKLWNILRDYDIQQQFFFSPDIMSVPPAYATIFKKPAKSLQIF